MATNTRPGATPPAGRTPDLNDVLAAARRWARVAFPDAPAGALVVVPAEGLPAVVIPLDGRRVPACVAAGEEFDYRG